MDAGGYYMNANKHKKTAKAARGQSIRVHRVRVIEANDTQHRADAWINGQMASGEHTWTFDGAEDGALYIAYRATDPETGRAGYVLVRQ